MKTINKITTLIIVFFFGAVFNWLVCNKPNTEIITKTDTITKTIYKDSIKYDTIIYSNVKLINDTIYVNDTIFDIDTIFFTINDYFAKVHYLDTLLNDSTGFISVSDTIFKNRLLNRTSNIEIYNKTILPVNDKISLFAGVFYLNGINNSLGANLSLERKKSLFSVGYGTNKTFLINYQYKIK
jgi:hypothetical protein